MGVRVIDHHRIPLFSLKKQGDLFYNLSLSLSLSVSCVCTYIHFASLSETRIEEHLFTPTSCSGSSNSRRISFLLLASSNKALLIPRAIAFSSSF